MQEKGVLKLQKYFNKKVLNTLDESERIPKIPKMQNLSQNELEQVTKMQNQSRDELEQIAKMRRIKNYKNMSKEELLIALLKPEQSRAKIYNKEEKNKEYPDHYDPDYDAVWNVKDLFDEINEDYYEPVITRSAFNGNYTQYESRGDKYKIYHPKNILK